MVIEICLRTVRPRCHGSTVVMRTRLSIKSLLHNLSTQNEGRITSTGLLLICDDGKFPVKK